MNNKEMYKLQKQSQEYEIRNEELAQELLHEKDKFLQGDKESQKLILKALKLKHKQDKLHNSISLRANKIAQELNEIQKAVHLKQREYAASIPELAAKTEEMKESKQKALEGMTRLSEALKAYVDSGAEND